jgi:hypothetical protein
MAWIGRPLAGLTEPSERPRRELSARRLATPGSIVHRKIADNEGKGLRRIPARVVLQLVDEGLELTNTHAQSDRGRYSAQRQAAVCPRCTPGRPATRRRPIARDAARTGAARSPGARLALRAARSLAPRPGPRRPWSVAAPPAGGGGCAAGGRERVHGRGWSARGHFAGVPTRSLHARGAGAPGDNALVPGLGGHNALRAARCRLPVPPPAARVPSPRPLAGGRGCAAGGGRRNPGWRVATSPSRSLDARGAGARGDDCRLAEVGGVGLP